jgi:hypothetical protein
MPRAAHAAPDVSVAVAVVAEGPDAAAARDEIAKNVGGGYRFVEPVPPLSAVARPGNNSGLAALRGAAKKRAAFLERVRSAATTAQVDEVVVVTTSRTPRGRRFAIFYVVDARTGESQERRVDLATASHALAASVESELTRLHPASAAVPPEAPRNAPPLAGQAPPPAPGPASPTPRSVDSSAAPSPSAEASDLPAPAGASRTDHSVGREWFEVEAGVEAGMRRLSYHDGLSTNLRSYHLDGVPLGILEAAVYPFTATGAFLASDIGLVGGYASAVALQSASAGAGTVGTRWARNYGGGCVRMRTGSTSGAAVLRILGAYGRESFAFDAFDPAAAYPSVDYRFVQASGDVRVPIGRFALTASAGYLFVLSAGDVATRFPRASVGGIDATLGGAVTIVPGLEARLVASYRRFFYSMNPTPGDSFVAGGALDEFWRATGTLAYAY